MKSIDLKDTQVFNDKHSHAEPLHVDRNGRVILFALKPEQTIREHNAPSSPFYLVVMSGKGIFKGEDGIDHEYGPNTLLVFDPGENHTIRALSDLVFIGFLHGAPGGYES